MPSCYTGDDTRADLETVIREAISESNSVGRSALLAFGRGSDRKSSAPLIAFSVAASHSVPALRMLSSKIKYRCTGQAQPTPNPLAKDQFKYVDVGPQAQLPPPYAEDISALLTLVSRALHS